MLQELNKFISKLDYKSINDNVLLRFQNNSHFFTFNYTETLQKIYKIKENLITHIHGKINSDNNELIIGHGTLLSSDGWDDEYNCFESRIIDLPLRKDTDPIIRKHKNFFCRNKLKNITNIYILGHSLSEIDKPYFDKLKSCIENENVTWYISCYNECKNKFKNKSQDYLDIFQDEKLKIININELKVD